MNFKLLALVSTFICSSAFAEIINLRCEVKHNLNQVLVTDVSLRRLQKNVKFGDFELFDFLVSSIGNERVELQILNHQEPSRSYATAVLSDSAPEVELSIWKREFLIEARCSLK